MQIHQCISKVLCWMVTGGETIQKRIWALSEMSFSQCFWFSTFCSVAECDRDIRSLPQDPAPSQSRDHAGNGSVFVNEAAFAGTSVNNRHVHHKRNDPSAHNCLNTLLARSNSRQPPVAKTPHSPHSDSQGWVVGTGYLYSPAGRMGLQNTPSGKNCHQVNVLSSVIEG